MSHSMFQSWGVNTVPEWNKVEKVLLVCLPTERQHPVPQKGKLPASENSCFLQPVFLVVSGYGKCIKGDCKWNRHKKQIKSHFSCCHNISLSIINGCLNNYLFPFVAAFIDQMKNKGDGYFSSLIWRKGGTRFLPDPTKKYSYKYQAVKISTKIIHINLSHIIST